jgi:D-alanyl-D-alanine carboxypeptidase/D-alanyl-D-alanine-endopeptidase (penicillin-binding protein 4)
LGPDHRFETTLEYSGAVLEGHLNGDVIIRGGGDPTLGSRHLGDHQDAFINDWVQWVLQAGIKVIKGNIIADPGLFDDEPLSPFWLWEDIGNYYAAGVYGLALFDNSYTLKLKSGDPGTLPDILSVQPELPELTIENHLKAADNSKDSAYFYGVPYQWHRQLYGTIPANRSVFSIRGDLPDPPAYAAYLLSEALKAAGVRVEGRAVSARQLPAEIVHSGESTLLGKTQSVPLSRLISLIHEKSDNLYAEYLLRHIALMVEKGPASARNGLKVIREFWTKKGLDVTGLYMTDGCGLSPLNKVSSTFMADLLVYMSTQSSYRDFFEKSLPLAGIQGTVSGFLKDTPLTGKVRLKSGSNQTTTSYAGYYRNKNSVKVVVMLVNHTDVPRFRVQKDMEKCLLSL